MFSPRMRGCSASTAFGREAVSVFPAYAGMFRSLPRWSSGGHCFPRIRGDVPQAGGVKWVRIKFSPHTRGSSASGCHVSPFDLVFPAYAGKFLYPAGGQDPHLVFSRMRGDVPRLALARWTPEVFSPHTRGYSRGKTCNEEDSSEKNLVNKEAYSASRLSALVTT